jgi:KDO2-lipid IV(A) lauroyltransferase
MGTFNHKEFKRAFARNSFYFFRGLFRHLPYGVVKAMTSVIISIGYFLVRSKRVIARESLDIAFGHTIDSQEKEKIIKKCFSNLGRGMIELLYYSDHPQMIKDKAFIENKEYLEEALKEGKGAILVSAHFGSFPLMLLRLVQEGFATSAIMRPFRDQIIEKDFVLLREKFGLGTIYSQPRTACVARSLKALRNNELLFIPLDQNFGTKGGVFVNFFGQRAATATGPAIFAMRTGAPIVPIFTHRLEDDRHRIIVEKPFYLDIKENDEATIFACIEKITQIIESYIRKYPPEWGWMHRRWKTQPKDLEDEKKADD